MHATSSRASCSQVSAYSRAVKPPTETHIGTSIVTSQTRQRLAQEGVPPGIRQPDRVEHPELRLGDANRRVPLARLRRHGLGDERVERLRDLRRRQRVEAAGRVQEKQHSTGPSTHNLFSSPSISTTQP